MATALLLFFYGIFFLMHFGVAPNGDAEPCINFDRNPSFNPITKCMKIAYIAEKEELQALIKECIHEQLEAIMKEINKSLLSERLNIIESAKYFGVGKATLYKLIRKSEIPFNKFGKKILFYREEIDQWLK